MVEKCCTEPTPSTGKAGLLVNPSTTLQRSYFNQLCELRGIRVKYRYPLKDKTDTLRGELVTHYSEPQELFVLYNQEITQQTSRLLGWNAELATQAVIVSVPYDLENIQVGALFDLPAAIDNAEDRTFRVSRMSTVSLYPASITCELVPEYKTTVEKSEFTNFKTTTFNLLNEG